MVVSPFVGPEALAALHAQVREDMTLVGRFDELRTLDPGAIQGIDVEVFDDPAMLLDVDEDLVDGPTVPEEGDPVELSGLHAKAYVGERGRRAAVYVGSANATKGAFALNVEFLVELEGSRKQHGIDAVRDGLRDAGLLRPFQAGKRAQLDEAGESLERALERTAHELAMALRARVEPAGEGRWRPLLELSHAVDVGDLAVSARPLAEPTLRPLQLGASPCCTFPPTSLSSLSAFFALRVSGRTASREHHLDVTVRLPLDDVPDGRIEAVTAELLGDRERLLRFILLLLSDEGDSDRMLDELETLLGEHSAGTGTGAPAPPLGLPLLEPMLRALHRSPERLGEIDRLLRDMRQAGANTTDLLPPELEALWTTINELREART